MLFHAVRNRLVLLLYTSVPLLRSFDVIGMKPYTLITLRVLIYLRHKLLP